MSRQFALLSPSERGAANPKARMGFYHVHIVAGDVATTLRRDLAPVGQFQIAGVPDRNEPDIG